MRKKFVSMFCGLLVMTAALWGCGDSGGAGSGTASATKAAFVITTDRSTGSFAVVDISSKSASVNVGDIHSDADAVAHGGMVYVINRLGADNIQVIDPDNGYSTIRQFSAGSGSNPYDIAFASASKAYVSRYGETTLLIVNPLTGESLGSIDLSAYADSDGIPEMAKLHIKSGRLYVAIQALDRNSFWVPTGQSRVVVVDTGTDTIISSVALPFQNPVGDFIELTDGQLAIACVGSYLSLDGGLAVIDPATGAASKGALTESLLGGDINSIALISDTSGFAVISDSSFNTILKKFDTESGSMTTILQSSGFNISGVAINDDELWVADRTDSNPGIRIFDTGSGQETTTAPISTGLPPDRILFINQG